MNTALVPTLASKDIGDKEYCLACAGSQSLQAAFVHAILFVCSVESLNESPLRVSIELNASVPWSISFLNFRYMII